MTQDFQPGTESLPDYYQVMGILPDSSRMEIKEAYLNLKNTYSQGSAAIYSLISEDEAKSTLQQIEAAYQVLEDDYKRKRYDLKMGYRTEVGVTVKPEAETASSPQNQDNGPPAEDHGSGGPKVVTTSRSTLPVIKTVAGTALNDNLQEDFTALIEASDPGDGDLFRRLREVAKVSEHEIHSRTKVSIEYIRAIETNRFEQLPQAVFVKGFLRSYFRYLAVPRREDLVEAFAKRLDAWQSEKKN